MLKKYVLFFLILISLFSISSCKKETKEMNKTKIVTSFYPMYIMALNISKDIPDVEVINMTKPQTGCLHDYQLIPDDIKCLEQSNIFIVNGAGMESFLEKVISQIPSLKIIEASKGLELIKGEGEEGDNPHLWVSVTNAIKQVKNIEEQLCLIDTKNSKLYKKNAEIYIKKLEDLKIRMHLELDNLKNKDIITFHEAFPYFAKEFNLNIVGVIEREPGAEPSAKELSDTIKIIKKSKVKALFAEPQYPSKSADAIANETGIKVYTLDPGVTGEADPDSYIKIMESNMITLKEALK
jgi:zinc transport system substrate-binding protein